jgi:hypothetical protein
MGEVAVEASPPSVAQRREVNVGQQAKSKINHGFARIFTDQFKAENHEQPLLAGSHFSEK